MSEDSTRDLLTQLCESSPNETTGPDDTDGLRQFLREQESAEQQRYTTAELVALWEWSEQLWNKNNRSTPANEEQRRAARMRAIDDACRDMLWRDSEQRSGRTPGTPPHRWHENRMADAPKKRRP